jgi:VWFA-related protein
MLFGSNSSSRKNLSAVYRIFDCVKQIDEPFKPTLHARKPCESVPPMRMIRAKPLLFFAIPILLAGNACAQESPDQKQQPTFRAQSNAVLVPALVKGRNSEIIYGLQAKDFIIEDDGVEQLVHLDEEPESEPVSLVVAVQVGASAAEELPRIRTLGTMLEPILSQGQTRCAIVTFDDVVELQQDFTANSARLSYALQRLESGHDTGAAILDAIGYSVALLKREPKERRRILLLVSETRDHGSHVVTVEDTVRAITESNTLVYTLAFSPTVSNVLDTLRGNTGKRVKPVPEEKRTPEEIVSGSVLADGTPRGSVPLMPFLVLAAQAMRKNTPKTIAQMSGGEYELFTSSKGFESRMIDFTNHLHNRYLLSFEPKDPHPGLHKVSVRLREPRGASILARDRYWAVPPVE